MRQIIEQVYKEREKNQKKKKKEEGRIIKQYTSMHTFSKALRKTMGS